MCWNVEDCVTWTISTVHISSTTTTAEDNHSEHPVNALNGGRGEQRQLT